MAMDWLKGNPGSPGISIGKALVLLPSKQLGKSDVVFSTPEEATASFYEAVKTTKREIEAVRDRTRALLGDDKAAIFEAHILLLEDPEIHEPILEGIKNKEGPVPQIVERIIREQANVLRNLTDHYLRERAADVEDVGRRLLQHLSGESDSNDLSKLGPGTIIVARDLTPSMVASLNPENIKAVVTELGGATSHVAILARGMGIPAALGVPSATLRVKNGQEIVVDGTRGKLGVDLTPEDAKTWHAEELKSRDERKALELWLGKPNRTADGIEMKLEGNVARVSDFALYVPEELNGIGLFRTEFLFLDRTVAPTEEEQLSAYKTAIEFSGSHGAVIRTLDVGGDKQVDYLDLPKEDNPFLGLRGIRFTFERHKVFRTQLRALLRASVYGRLRILFPMISNVEEVREAKRWLAEVTEELRTEKKKVADKIEIGVMIETPAAVFLADVLADECDFFSIGTNDLTQYITAVDRTNETVAHLAPADHPAVLRALAHTVKAAKSRNKSVAICGEAAQDVSLLPFFIGIGLRELSMHPSSVLRVRKVLAGLDVAKCEVLSQALLSVGSQEEVKKLLNANL